MLSRPAAEAGVALITTAMIAVALGRNSLCPEQLSKFGVQGMMCSGPLAGVATLPLLALLAILAEHTSAACLGRLYRQRQAGSSGLTLGALVLPWTFAGLAAKQQQEAGTTLPPPAAHAMHACVAASSAALLVLRWQWQRRQDGAGSGQNGMATRQERQYSSAAAAAAAASNTLWPAWVTAAALLILLAAAAAEYAGSGLQHAVALLAIAACAGGGMHALLALLPGVLTVGEALAAAQAAALLGHSALQELAPSRDPAAPAPFQRFVVLLATGSLVATAALIPLLLRCQPAKHARAGRTRRQSAASGNLPPAAATAAAAVAVAAAAAIAPAALWAVRYALSSQRRLLLLCWWAADLVAALPAMHLLNRSGRVPPILVRKGYHLLAVSLFLPALLLEPQLLGVALAGALAALLALEVLRLSGLPGVAPRLHAFMTSFTDGRDSGLLLVTHLTLLLGMAAPVWLSNALNSGGSGGSGGSDTSRGQPPLWLAAHAGILILGFGDTAASAVGSQLGRHPICRGCSKTVEGTAAAAAATLAAWWLLAAVAPAAAGGGMRIGSSSSSWGQLAAATVLSCLLEATTTQLDNIFMPLHYFALLCLLPL